MSKYLLKISAVLLITALFAGISITINAQPPEGGKARERIKQLKKIKLLEILNMDEQTSEKFLIKYSAVEKKVEEKKKAMDDAVEELELSIKKEASKDEINQKTQKLLQAQTDFQNAIEQSLKEIKTVLNDVQYAKYLVFEHRFREEVQKAIFDRMKKRGGGVGPGRKWGDE